MSKHHLIFAKDKPDEIQKRKYKTRQLWCFLHEILKKKKKVLHVWYSQMLPVPLILLVFLALFCAGEEICFLIFLFNTSCSSH